MNNHRVILQPNHYYVASSNEVLTANITATSDGARGIVFIYGFDKDNNKIRLGAASVHFFNTNGGDTWVACNSVSVGLVKGQKYRIEYETTSGTVEVNAFAVVFPNT